MSRSWIDAGKLLGTNEDGNFGLRGTPLCKTLDGSSGLAATVPPHYIFAAMTAAHGVFRARCIRSLKRNVPAMTFWGRFLIIGLGQSLAHVQDF